MTTASSPLDRMSRTELRELWRFWADPAETRPDDDLPLRESLHRLMTDPDVVGVRVREMPKPWRDLLSHVLSQDDHALAAKALRDRNAPDAFRGLEPEAAASELRVRGFLVEERDKSWVRYQETVWRLPEFLVAPLAAVLDGAPRTLEGWFTLKGFLRTVSRDTSTARLRAAGWDDLVLLDRAKLAQELVRRPHIESAIASLSDARLREAATRALDEHGGLLDVGQLERMDLRPDDAAAWQAELEARFLGTMFTGDLADIGIQFKPGSLILFGEIAQGWCADALEIVPDEEPQASADPLADLTGIRAFLNNHSVRCTREGAMYRATVRKMETELLTPGFRPLPPDDVMDFLLGFLTTRGFTKVDEDQRLRPRPAWEAFESQGPVERGHLLLQQVQEDLRGSRSEFHQLRLRRILLSRLRETAVGRWVDIRRLAHMARNHYFATIDQKTSAERFQRRYQYAPVPPLVTPGVLSRELVTFATERLSLAGLSDTSAPEFGTLSVRLSKLGAGVLGAAGETPSVHGPGLLVMADFEVVVFPDGLEIETLHRLGKFARREKSDVTLHYRISERSVQEAVAAGLTAEDMLAALRKHARYPIPQSVSASIEAWAKAVTVLEVRRSIVIRAASKEALDAALKIREFRAVAGERLTETLVEVSEDPNSARIAEALRAQGFFLR